MEKVKSEPLKITNYEFGDEDLGLLDLVINADQPLPAVSIPVNDEADEPYYVYLRVHPDTHRVVGATLFHVDNLFAELAQAFANKDLNNPDIRFFLEKKLECYAERLAHEKQGESFPATSSEPLSPEQLYQPGPLAEKVIAEREEE